MKRQDINVRVLLVALVPALTIALLLSLYFARERLVDLERSLSERGAALARQLAPAAEFGVFSGNRELLERLAAAVANETGVTAVTIRDSAGNVLANSGGIRIPPMHDDTVRATKQSEEDAGDTLVSSSPILQSRVELEEFFTTSLRDGESGRNTLEPKLLGVVYVAISKLSITAQRRRLFVETLVITLLILAANVFIAVRMSRSVSRPIVKLTQAVQEIADGNLDTRVAPDSDGVIRGLEVGVNVMAAALKSAHADLEQRITLATVELERKKEEAERANRAKSRFLAAASHDLRQPLHALGLFVASLRDKSLPPEAARIASQIERSVAAMQELLEALLDISRLDAGGVVPAVTEFPVERVLSAIETHFAPTAHGKALSFRKVSCKAIVRSDSVLLERMLMNLVSNAVRYTAQGRILVGCRRCGNDLRVEVWDTGVGIPESEQRYIFDEFYRVARGEDGGLGLGLAIVDGFARLLEHEITIRSKPGHGSTFAVRVPRVAREFVNDGEVARLDAVGFAGASVMVIDDDSTALSSTKMLLESWGCKVYSASSGSEAQTQLSGLGDRFPQFVICDYRLSARETGIDVLTQLRDRFLPDIPAILISADTSAEVAAAAKQSGYPLLHKPLRPAKLRSLALHLLHRTGKQHDRR